MQRDILYKMLANAEPLNAPDHYHQTTSPELRLIFAVLERAIADAVCWGKGEESTKNRVQAMHWLFRPLDYSIPFSFAWICAETGFTPMHIRCIVDKLRIARIRPDRHRVQRMNFYPIVRKRRRHA